MMSWNICIFMLTFWSFQGKSSYNSTFRRGFNQTEIEGQLSNLFRTDEHLNRYLRYNEIIHEIKEIESQYSQLVQVVVIGKSEGQRNIFLVKLSNSFTNCKKITFVESGIHGSALIGPSYILHTIKQILNEPRLLKHTDWYTVPVANPDGYEKSFKKKRSQQKTRQYASQNELMQPEAQAVLYTIDKLKSRIVTYISVQSLGPYILYPYAKTDSLPFDWVELNRCGLEAQKAVLKNGGPIYKLGSYGQTLPVKPGSVIDYMKEDMNIPFSYAILIPEGDEPDKNISQAVRHSFPLIRVLSYCFS